LADTGLEGATVPVGAALRFAVFPCFDDSEPDVRDGYAATAVAVDLVYTDGSRLSGHESVDQYGIVVDPQAQYGSQLLSVDQWSARTVALDGGSGKTVQRVELCGVVPARTDGSGRERLQHGFVDSFGLVDVSPAEAEPVDCVRTTRGSFSSDRFSRGGCAPLVAVPHGFVFGLPMTDGGNRGWPYSYHEASRVDTNPPQDASTDTASVRPYLQAFATSHIPSPWMGDRGSFQVFPHPLAHPNPDRHERALPFSHDDETDRPHLYSVVLDDGVHPPVAAELTAGSHAIWLRATYGGDTGSLVFDQIDGDGFLDLPDPVPGQRYTASGYVDGPGGLTHVPRTYVHVEVDGRVLSARRFPGHERESVIGTLTVGLDAANRSVTVGIGVSHISLEQAKRNLGAGFDAVVADTRAQWNEILGRLTVDGVTPEQRTTLYSSLYRVHLYPNTAAEPTPEGWRFASPFAYRTDVDDSPTTTGRRVVDGLLTVTDGFWDSYRASWPLRTLIAPGLTGRLLEGFVEHYRDGGWVSRWSAPAPADIMTGTSSDAVFADAALAGIGELGDYSVLDAYDSCLRNATVPSDNRFVGRKGMDRSMFTGYADTQAHEGLSWTIDAAINDAAIAAFSVFLLRRYPDHERSAEFAANATWFAARAARYALMFDEQTGFFRGREPVSAGVALGPWRAGAFDPRDWGTDYTETNAWGTRFTAPQDGEGLAQLYGGREGLERRLDEFMALSETGREEFKGGYPVVIHEMREARDTRMGMLALSNQPAHHIPFMYAFASRHGSHAHAKTQAIVRDAVERLFTGSDLGQGYPGDEDNGEMSAWYLLAVSGLYPLTIGSGQFVLCAPLYRRLTWTMDNGARIEIVAPAASAANRYIQAVRVDGQAWDRITIERERLVDGAVIEFDLGPTPSDWAAGTVPPSLTPLGSAPAPPVDLTSPERAPIGALGLPDAGNAFDDSSGTAPVVLAEGQWLGWEFEVPTALDHYTLTVVEAGDYAWEFQARSAAGDWSTVARQRARFQWDRQTRVFGVETVAPATAYRLVFDEPVHVAQLEFLRLLN
jgi:predicted alpha-1,2-mannosidase